MLFHVVSPFCNLVLNLLSCVSCVCQKLAQDAASNTGSMNGAPAPYTVHCLRLVLSLLAHGLDGQIQRSCSKKGWLHKIAGSLSILMEALNLQAHKEEIYVIPKMWQNRQKTRPEHRCLLHVQILAHFVS